jgi:CheY-like chemotaxis protein
MRRRDGDVMRPDRRAGETSMMRVFSRWVLRHSREPRGAAPAPADEQAGVLQAVSRLAGGVGHDLNNILLVLQGYAEMATETGEAGPAVLGILKEMGTAIGRASGLVRDLLVVGERAFYHPHPLDVSEVLRRRLPAVSASLPSGVELRPVLSDSVGPVMADEDLLVRIIEALCDRAVDAMPRGGTVTVMTVSGGTGEAARAVLLVRDTGGPLSEEQRARFFEPYLPGPGGGKGQALGLAVVLAATKLLGGNLRVSAEPGGTTFELALPVGTGPAAAVRTAPPGERADAIDRERRGGSSPRGAPVVLVAEDDQDLRALARRILGREGFDVVVAQDGQEAVEIIERDGKGIGLAILDDVMPRMGGRAALARIRAIAPRLPVILCSGYDWHLGESGPGAPAGSLVLRKPWQPGELVRKVRECLGNDR